MRPVSRSGKSLFPVGEWRGATVDTLGAVRVSVCVSEVFTHAPAAFHAQAQTVYLAQRIGSGHSFVNLPGCDVYSR